MVTLQTHADAPASYLALVWEIFFASRQRGIGLAAHFPWLQTARNDTWYVTASVHDRVVAGLAVRGDAGTQGETASLGLVCVAPSHRGQGLSGQLLDQAIRCADARGIRALRLWTSKPGVYRSVGFETADLALFGSATRPDAAVDPLSWERRAWPDGSDSRGLPPFAASGHVVLSDEARVITVEDARGPIVAEWAGAAAAVAHLMENALPRDLRINASQADPVLAELSRRGWKCPLDGSHLQMIRPLDDDLDAQAWARRHALSVLDRI